MKGVNTLILNSATMMQAVQEYLDKRTTPEVAVQVTGVEQSFPLNEATFKITVEEKKMS